MFDRWRRPAPEETDDPFAEIFALLFPGGLDDVQHHLVRHAIGDSPPTSAAVRVLLGSLDRQTIASPVGIRWGLADLDVVGVGANVGYHAFRASSCVGADGRVIAV